MSNSDEQKKYTENYTTEKIGVFTKDSTVNIEKLFVGQSSSSQPTTGIPNNVPRKEITDFVGRDAELIYLHEQLMQPNQVSAFALYGIGGVGKTKLATKYAVTYLEEYSGGICWLLSRDTDVSAQIINFARFSLGIEIPKEDIKNQLNFCWSHWREGKVLIVFDDVTDFYRIQPYLPPLQPRFHVLITTRLQFGLSGIKFLEIKVLSEVVALELLRSNLKEGDIRIEEEIDQAKELCRWLDYLPLGLELIGRYLARKEDLSLSTMLQRLYNEKLSQEAINESNGERGINTVFELSWQELSEDAKMLSYFLSLFALAPIPWWLVEQLQFEQKPDNIENLRDDWLLKFSLLQRQERGFYQFHHLIREFIQGKLNNLDDAAALKKSFCYEVANLTNQLLDGKAPDAIETTSTMIIVAHIEEMATTLSYQMDDWELYSSHRWLLSIYTYLGIYTQAAYWGEKCESEMISRFGREHLLGISNQAFLVNVYVLQGNLRKAEQYLVDLLALCRKFFGDEDSFVAHILSDLGSLLATQGHFEEAENYCREALAIQEKILGENNPDIALNLSALAKVCRIRGQYAEAQSLYDRIFNFESSQSFIANSPLVIIEISTLWLEQGLVDEAEQICDRAKEVAENSLGNEHPIYAMCLSELAGVYVKQGRHQEAELCCKKAIEINETKGNTMHPTHAINLKNLALIYTAQGRHEDAEILYKFALKIQQDIFGQEHMQIAETLVNLAINYLAQNEYKQAEPLLLRGQEMYKSTLGTTHPQYSELLCILANVRFQQQDYEKAESLFREAINVVEEALGTTHPKVSEKLSNLAYFLISQNQDGEALPLFDKSLKVAKEAYGEDNPNVCQYILSIAEVYRSRGRESEADSMYAQAIGIYEQDDKINPDFAEGLMNLIELYESQRRYEEVGDLYERLLATSRRLLGNDHANIVQILSKLGKLRTDQWRYEEAIKLYEEALEMRKRIFNEMHPSIATNMVNLAYIYQSLNRFAEAQELYGQALNIRIHEYGNSHYQVRFVQNALVNLDISWSKSKKYLKEAPANLLLEPQHSDKKIIPNFSESEQNKNEEQISDLVEVLNQEVANESKSVKLKASEIKTLERQKAKIESEFIQLDELHNSINREIENYKQRHQNKQSNILIAANELISLTHDELEKLSEPLSVVLSDLEQQRKEYQQTWEKLQIAIQQFNKYREETDEISVHLHTHYQADQQLLEKLLPLDSQKVESILKIICDRLSELDQELSDARTKHERSQQKSIITF
ncbi:tetratricopeptide repeat protein [Anabaena cylindrica UHCC 0172]|uniref:tetratricopeptide repeat protein n=1 Tax=Anabaena cylindrica TaxID=1165 RepID=UPI002B2192DB|nr:tetratricopeptide repeat protein [Anabaena cylindrica]MEA5554038.1 tetratricopeptide repeat protein [Anabaena cylindrica UHCC 0172]